MAYFELLEDTFIGNSLKKAGAIVRYDGEPGLNMKKTTQAAFDTQPEPQLDHPIRHQPPIAKSPNPAFGQNGY